MKIADILNLSLKQIFFILVTGAFVYQILGRRLVENQNYYNLAALLLWLTAALLLSAKTLIHTLVSTKYTILGIFLIFIMITGAMSGDYISTLKYIFGFTIVVSPIMVCDFIISYGNKQISRLILYISLVILSYYSIMTNIMIYKYPTISRQLASGSEEIMNFYYGLNIGGGYSLVYGLVFLVLVLLNHYKNDKSKKIYLVLITLYIFTMINSAYLIAIVVTFAGAMITYFNRSRVKNVLLVLSLLILLLTAVITNVPKHVGDRMISYSLNHEFLLDHKMLEIGNMLSGNKLYDYENVEGRTSRMKISVESFKDSPLIGNGRYTGYNSDTEVGIIGQHSEWVDSIARFGIIGVVLLILFFINSLKSLYKKESYAVIPFTFFLLLGFINPVLNFTIFFILFFIQKLLHDFSADLGN